MEKEKIAVIIDSNIFGEKDKYDFSNIKLTSFVKKMNGFSNIDIFLPSIVIEEVKRHIKEAVKKDKISKKSKYFKDNISRDFYDNIIKITIDKFEDFIIDNDIKIIDCNEYINIKQVNNWYFNMCLPFEESKKKEFPDAMIVSSIINYFEKNHYNECLVISSDAGFRKAIEENSKIKTLESTSEILKSLFDIDENEIFEILKYLNNSNIMEELDCYWLCSADSTDQIDMTIEKAKINSIQILDKEVQEDTMVLTVEVTSSLHMTGDIVIVDPYESIYDKELPECSSLVYKQAKEMDIKNVNVYLALYKDSNSKIIKYEIVEKGNIEFVDYLNQMTRYNDYS